MIIKWYLIKDKILWTRYVVWWWITIGIPLIAFMSLPKKLRHKIRQKLRQNMEHHSNELGKEIELKEGMTGIIVYAEEDNDVDRWIIIINKVETFGIRRHVSYNLKNDVLFFDNPGEACWGQVYGHTFYEATTEQKKFIASKMIERNLKYISTLNKLVKI